MMAVVRLIDGGELSGYVDGCALDDDEECR